MPISLTNQTKNTTVYVNQSRSSIGDAFGDHPETFGEQSGTFGAPNIGLVNETKNTTSYVNETKN